MRIRQNAVKLFFLIVQRIQAGLVTQQQPSIDLYRMLHCPQTTLATQPAVSAYADPQQRSALPVCAAVNCVLHGSLRIFQRIQQTRQLCNGHFAAYFLAISSKIQAVDERPCVHEARMIYFSPPSVKNPKE